MKLHDGTINLTWGNAKFNLPFALRINERALTPFPSELLRTRNDARERRANCSMVNNASFLNDVVVPSMIIKVFKAGCDSVQYEIGRVERATVSRFAIRRYTLSPAIIVSPPASLEIASLNSSFHV